MAAASPGTAPEPDPHRGIPRPAGRRDRAGGWWDAVAVTRFTSFRFCLDPTVEQQSLLARHAGAARFAFNQCLAMTKQRWVSAAANRTPVPWTGFDHISVVRDSAGRRFPRRSRGRGSCRGHPDR
ncbi:helix-turn-helix domain-containing protein [Nocardia sp. CA-135953]|uniref:helix-turn-helix domain-containing protein n=1 Tax=Nocardia sp. CA-135953 TaxID=3239978 RepID=UPI003D95F275